MTDIVETLPRAEESALAPLLVLDRVREFLDANGLGTGDVRAHPAGKPCLGGRP